MTMKTSSEPPEGRQPQSDLDRRYGRIGISALVAALPYGGEARRQDGASLRESPDQRAA